MELTRYLLLVVVVFATFCAMIEAYGFGAPARACEGAQPIHTTDGNSVQPLDPANNPYSFSFSPKEYIPGQDIIVTISEASGGVVNGFFLQGRRRDTGVAVGTFIDPLPTGAQFRQCTTGVDNSVTHTNPNGKTDLIFTWSAPAAGTGDVEFVGAVAINHDNFYGGMKSEVLPESDRTVTGESTEKPQTTATAFKMSSGFGIPLLAAVISMLQIFL